MLRVLPLFVCAALCAVPFTPPQPVAAQPPAPPVKANASGIEYNRDIRPILAENCFACHGPDSAARKAGFAARPPRRTRSKLGAIVRRASRTRAN